MTNRAANEQELTSARIFKFYFPLAASWVFMAVEAPVAIAIISRLPDGTLHTAAFLIMMGLAMWIESPIIDLLSTSTTLSKNNRDYLTLRKFVFQLLAFVTVAHALVVFTPLYWTIAVGVMRVPREVAEAAHIGLMIMLPWSPLIGWRRYLQGILIRFGRTKRIGMGTFVRMSTMALVGINLYHYSDLHAITIAAIALVCSVAAETLYVHFAAKSVIRDSLAPTTEEEQSPPLTVRALLKFHLPLTATTSMMMLGTPIVGSALSRTPDSVLLLAGWQVAMTLLWLHRTVVFALPEVVIALYNGDDSAKKLKTFSISVGLCATGVLLVVAALRLDELFFASVLSANPETIAVAHVAFLACALLPIIGALQSYVRGMLTAHHLTVARLTAVMVAVGTLLGLLALAELFGQAGILASALATTISLLAELGVLAYSWKRGRRRLEAAVVFEPVAIEV